MDALSSSSLSQAPSAVFHSTTVEKGRTVQPGTDLCSVTTGLLVLTPSRSAFEQALHHLKHEMNIGMSYAAYDGSDQEFFRSFYSAKRGTPWYELPLRYQTHQMIKPENASDWTDMRAIHIISGFRQSHARVPPSIRARMRYFK